MTSHCGECGSQICNHGACPECNPCRHCNGGDRTNKHFKEDDLDYESAKEKDRDFGLDGW